MPYRVPYADNGFFYYPVCLSYHETDMGGIVYHARYLELAERARAYLLRAMGIPLDVSKGFCLVIHSCAITYHRSITVDDLLWIRTGVGGASAVRMVFSHSFLVKDVPCATMDITTVLVDSNGKPKRIPPSLLDSLTAFLHPVF